MSIYLHIGFPKTASSWFQKNFFPFLQNVQLPDRKTIQTNFLEPGAFEFDAGKVAEKFRFRKDNNVLISDELLLGRLRPGGVKGFLTKEIAERLKNVFPGAVIILFIRNQADILLSSYLQYVRSGGNYSIRKFLFPEDYRVGHSNRLVLLGLDYFLYDEVISYYRKLFGKENVHIYLYEDFRENSVLFVEKFAQRYGFTYKPEAIDYKYVNQGYRKLLVYTRRITNALSNYGPLYKYYLVHIPYMDNISRYLHEAANRYRIFGRHLVPEKFINRHDLVRIKSFYSRSNKKLAEEFGLTDILKYNYPL